MRAAVPVLVGFVVGCSGTFPHATLDLAVTPSDDATYLRYHVHSTRTGDGTRELVFAPDGFADRRDVLGRDYVLGARGDLAWMRAGTRPPVAIDAALLSDELPQTAWLGLRYAHRAPGDRLELESCEADMCTWVYVPTGGHALWIDVDRATHKPRAFHWVDAHDAIESCEGVAWTEQGGASVIASATCSAIVDHVGRESTTWTLEPSPRERMPVWASVDRSELVPLPRRKEPATFAIADPSARVLVPVEAGGAPALDLVLDTGSAVTVLTHRVARAMGVVPTDDAPVHVRPPWLPESTFDVAIVDRLVMGGVELHGVPVLVAREDDPFGGEEAGLLGVDLLARFVVDVDAPASTLRLYAPGTFPTPPGAVDLPFVGASHGCIVVDGAIDEIGPVPVILDTGAPLNVVVGGPAMHARHPRHGEATLLENGGLSPDYETEIEGFHLGPFPLPRMPATGRDRLPELPLAFDGGTALAGLGVMRHFRLAFDVRDSVVHAVPGPSYIVLRRLGIEIDDRSGAPTVTRVVGDERSWRPLLREGDVVRKVDRRRVTSRAEALAALAGAKGPSVVVAIERRGNVVVRRVPLAAP